MEKSKVENPKEVERREARKALHDCFERVGVGLGLSKEQAKTEADEMMIVVDNEMQKLKDTSRIGKGDASLESKRPLDKDD